MEQHPVPQNVTTFQFRLIGDMTIKQFGYLAGGAILAYVSYKLPLPIFFTWPLTALFALGGIGFAFVPVEERPMDVWVLSFIKSVYNPTQYLWHKTVPTETAGIKKASPSPKAGLTTKLAPQAPEGQKPTALPTPNLQNLTAKSQPAKQSLSQIIANIFTVQATGARSQASPQNQATPPTPPASQTVYAKPPTIPSANTANDVANLQNTNQQQAPDQKVQPSSLEQNLKTIDDDETKAAALKDRIEQLQKEVQEKTQTDVRILELQKQMTQILDQKNKMEKELNLMRQRFQAQPNFQPGFTRPAGFSMNTTRAPTVNVMAPDQTIKAGLPRLTTVPNVVTGITKDGEGNYLPGVLVTVRDQNDIPLRALKTNKLGQFAASTPLPNGTYLIEIEDPRERYAFDRAQITLNGSVMPALEIIAKSQKELTREKLQKEIFGNQQI